MQKPGWILPWGALLAGAIATAPLFAQADDIKPSDCKSDQVWIKFLDNAKCYGKGDKVPDSNSRGEVALRDWKAKQLPPPEDNAQWVASGDHYLMINRENATLIEIRDKQGQEVK
ncbi:RcnB family protein [Pseudomonas typographi]|uniref:Lipoprotein n=1 Tax=Pseudomonas typographi TaxID=2715964 RepID=A0ABR7YZV8_9PSED|nr:RcnB family protein [Pseudomonas typographi]MBD1550597.1 hypothetical protein [Pseudomonas typographi]MBD1586818.1 hypothetical protein [Pseudomonas typographi]MBD1598712.1 hypothetical protein [Pseudomonas typographi]